MLARADRFANARAAFARALTIAPAGRCPLRHRAWRYAEDGQYACRRRALSAVLPDRPSRRSGRAVSISGSACSHSVRREAGYECFRAVGARRCQKRYGLALSSLVKSSRGRFWLKPSDASRFLRGGKELASYRFWRAELPAIDVGLARLSQLPRMLSCSGASVASRDNAFEAAQAQALALDRQALRDRRALRQTRR